MPELADSLRRKKLKTKYKEEQVYVVPYKDLEVFPDKFHSDDELYPYGTDTLNLRNGRFVFRYDAEYNPALLQLIPYVLVFNSRHDKIFVTERIAGEERLKGSLSIGYGGHINPCDSGKDIVLRAAVRELNEELNFKLCKNTEMKQMGIVQDKGSATCEHFGIVYQITGKQVSVKETDKMHGRWMSMHDLIVHAEKLESWSRYIADYLYMSGLLPLEKDYWSPRLVQKKGSV